MSVWDPNNSPSFTRPAYDPERAPVDFDFKNTINAMRSVVRAAIGHLRPSNPKGSIEPSTTPEQHA